MNKTELIKKVAAENGLTQKDAAGVVDSVLNSIMDSLAARKPVTLIALWRQLKQMNTPTRLHGQNILPSHLMPTAAHSVTAIQALTAAAPYTAAPRGTARLPSYLD